jgi:hypothetical protein
VTSATGPASVAAKLNASAEKLRKAVSRTRARLGKALAEYRPGRERAGYRVRRQEKPVILSSKGWWNVH